MKLRQIHYNYNEDMAKAQEKAYLIKLREIEEKLVYNEMMRQNEQKQLMKEANYRNVIIPTLSLFLVLQTYCRKPKSFRRFTQSKCFITPSGKAEGC